MYVYIYVCVCGDVIDVNDVNSGDIYNQQENAIGNRLW